MKVFQVTKPQEFSLHWQMLTSPRKLQLTYAVKSQGSDNETLINHLLNFNKHERKQLLLV